MSCLSAIFAIVFKEENYLRDAAGDCSLKSTKCHLKLREIVGLFGKENNVNTIPWLVGRWLAFNDLNLNLSSR